MNHSKRCIEEEKCIFTTQRAIPIETGYTVTNRSIAIGIVINASIKAWKAVFSYQSPIWNSELWNILLLWSMNLSTYITCSKANEIILVSDWASVELLNNWNINLHSRNKLLQQTSRETLYTYSNHLQSAQIQPDIHIGWSKPRIHNQSHMNLVFDHKDRINQIQL